MRLIASIGEALQHVGAAAGQFKTMGHRGCMPRRISDCIAPVIGPPKPPETLPAAGSRPGSG
jgi:hypothetical protein